MAEVKLLWLTPRWLLPAQDGARQATYQLVRSLVQLGVEIQLIAIVAPGEVPNPANAEKEAAQTLGVSAVHILEREPTRHFWNLLRRPWLPLTIAPFMSPKLGKRILKLHRDWDPTSIIVFDGLHSAGWYGILPGVQRRALRIVHRSHNVESNLWRLGARQFRYPRAMFLKIQAHLVSRFEQMVCRESSLVATVSENDARGLRERYGSEVRTLVTPIGFPSGPSSVENTSLRKNLLFVGRLDWPPNREGLRWFLQEVWPEAVRTNPELSLTIVGVGDSAWLKPFLSLPQVEFKGPVADLEPYYRDCVACLVPIFFGSGTRVKAIEAGSRSRACISTEIGVEGIGLQDGKSYFRAETREDWLRILTQLTPEDALRRGRFAHTWITEQFDPMRVASRFLAGLSG